MDLMLWSSTTFIQMEWWDSFKENSAVWNKIRMGFGFHICREGGSELGYKISEGQVVKGSKKGEGLLGSVGREI